MRSGSVSILLLLLITLTSAAQDQSGYNPARTYTPEEIKRDMGILYEVLRELDPALYRYNTQKEVASTYNRLAEIATKDMTAAEVTKKLVLPFVVALKDLNFIVHPPVAAEEYLRASGNYFPFDVRIREGRMYVWDNYSNNASIQDKGRTEILEINGHTAKSIIKELEPYIVADGNSLKEKRRRDLEESFPTYYAIVYGRPETFNILIKPNSNQKTTIAVSSIGWGAIATARQATTDTQKMLGLDILNAETALLTVRTFTPESISMRDKNFELFIDSSFAIINEQKIKNLILDLRSNIGGRTNLGARIYSHLTPSPFRYVERVEIKYPHTFPAIAYTNLGRSYLTNTYGIRPSNDSTYYTLETFQWVHEQPASSNTFQGKLYVLIDAYTLSSAALLASMLQFNYRNVTFIGEETGGNYRGHTGSLAMVTLPATKIRVYFPLRNYISPPATKPEKYIGQTNHGIRPGIAITPSIGQLMSGEDAILNKAIKATQQ